MRDLHAEVLATLQEGPLPTGTIVALVGARYEDVLHVLRGPGFEHIPSPPGAHASARYWRIAETPARPSASFPKSGSQCARVLSALADGEWHGMRDVHRVAGFMRLNSRVSELRGRGYRIECERRGNDYFYRLAGHAGAEAA